MFLSPCRAKREAKEFFSFLSQVPEWGLEWALFFAMGGDAFEWMIIRLADRFRGKGFDRLQAESMLRDERANRILQKLRGLQQYFTKVRKAKKEREKVEEVIKDIVSGKLNPYTASKKELLEKGFSYSSDGYKEVFSLSFGSEDTYCWNNKYGEGVCNELDRYLYGGLLTSHSHSVEITIMRGNWYDSGYGRRVKFAISIDVRSKSCFNKVDVKDIYEEDARYIQRSNRGSRSTSVFSLEFATNDETSAKLGVGVGFLLFNVLSSLSADDERVVSSSREDIFSGLVDSGWIITCSYDTGMPVFRYEEYRSGRVRLHPFVSIRSQNGLQSGYSDVYNNKKQCSFIRLRKEGRVKREKLTDYFISFHFRSFSGGNRFFWFEFEEYERDVWGTYKKVVSYSGGSNTANQQGQGFGVWMGIDSLGQYRIATSSENLSGGLYVYKSNNYVVDFVEDGFKLSVPSEEKKPKARRKRKVIC